MFKHQLAITHQLAIIRYLYPLYFLCIYLWFAWIYTVYCGRAEIGLMESPGHWLIPLFEVFFCYYIGRSFAPQQVASRQQLGRIIYFTVPLVLALIYIVQGFSLYLSNSYLTVLALENAAERRLTNGPMLNGTFAAFIIAWGILLATHWNMKPSGKAVKPLHKSPIMWCWVAVGIIGVSTLDTGDTSLLTLRENESPVIALGKTLTLTLERQLDNNGTFINPSTSLAENIPFPYQKDFTFHNETPFKHLSKTDTPPNVIVIFAEGLSARLTGTYGGKRKDLTPNIDQFAKRSMQVDNYFNHTAATHRGLQGFLTSAYPAAGGAEAGTGWEEGDNATTLALTHYKTLTKVLQNKGYETFFMSPHPDSVHLNSMLRSLDFDKVYTFASLQQTFLDNKATLTGRSISDKDMFFSLTRFLEQRQNEEGQKPFYLSIYNIGTHAFLDVGAEGIKYADGSNAVLNRMHNYDAQLKQFLSYFYASPYAKNTVLVFTSDHATYAEPPMVAAMKGEDYQPYFVDRIPLLIHAPTLLLPKRYDADGRTSVDLAPTLLNMLGIQDRSNSFLGRSIFETSRPLPYGVAAIGSQFYLTDRNGAYSEKNIPPAYLESFKQYTARIQNYYRLEKANRIYQETPDPSR